jgi:MoaA/NifB/PqqE/SkfB family radical SAM enzyme
MIEDLAPLKNLTIRASIEGPEQIHNIIRRSKTLNAYQSSIDNLLHAKQAGIPVQITSSINHINYTSIYEMTTYLVDYGLDNIRLRLSMPAGHANYHWSILKLNRSEYASVLEQVDRVHQQFPGITFNAETINRAEPSIAPKFFIDPTGMVKPYPFIEHYVGDLKTETVKEALENIERVSYPEEDEKKICDYLNELQIGGK